MKGSTTRVLPFLTIFIPPCVFGQRLLLFICLFFNFKDHLFIVEYVQGAGLRRGKEDEEGMVKIV